MTKKLSSLLWLFILCMLAACSKPYGHYEDDKMIGTVLRVEPDNHLLEVDISEWHKRDLRGGIDDYGMSVTVENTDEMVFKKEDGTLTDAQHIKIGQKVLVKPPMDQKDGDYKAEEIIVLEMTYKEKYKQLLSNHKDLYRITVFTKEDPLPQETEKKLMDLLSKSTLGIGSYPENYIVDYEKELDIEQYSVFLVFDHKGFVFKSYDVEEVEAFID
ncbi:hypothetical protein RB620_19375 [Paenibacillus sp. LHD-117]|uniref:hypothetical protein n=1 Tax=Paenibacillus sp. LHD-117 TaxID=3071412 RepID=UPI0027DF6119|nr:hypothetical protein [Paenibacillus sp. LHD-117]MDQ6421591.1 hypothetical protein [Paenibacillus sp. LHD-117]